MIGGFSRRRRSMTTAGDANVESGDRDPDGSREPYEDVREAVPLPEVAGRYTDLRKVGDRHLGRCPLPDHDDKSPSFNCYPDASWWCYGCGRGGDVVDLEFHCGDHGESWEAMISLAVDYDVDITDNPRSWFARQERQALVRDAVLEARVHAIRRRLYRRYCEPVVLATEDAEDRAYNARLLWEATGPLAEHLVARTMGRR